MPVTVGTVFIAALITALATGLGALPFAFVRNINRRWLGYGNAIAAGLMLGASIGLVSEGFAIDPVRTIIGAIVGVVLIILARRLLSERADVDIGDIAEADAMKMLLIVGIMTVHSFAEGIGVGVSYGDGEQLGNVITAAIAIHNIPEGLAISLVLIPRGISVLRAGLWSIFSSLPQPIMAVPAYLFVLTFKPFLPVGLGLAAGAMVWMVFSELLSEAERDIPNRYAWATMLASTAAMLLFNAIIG